MPDSLKLKVICMLAILSVGASFRRFAAEVPNGDHPELNEYTTCAQGADAPNYDQGFPCLPGLTPLGHVWPDGIVRDPQKGGLDVFGMDFKYFYDLCAVAGSCRGPAYWNGAPNRIAWSDADGDGIPSGIEIGDPCGRWVKGMLPARNFSLSDPGEVTSIPDREIVEACDCSLPDEELEKVRLSSKYPQVPVCLPRWPPTETSPSPTPNPTPANFIAPTPNPTPSPTPATTSTPTPSPTPAPNPAGPQWACKTRALCSILPPRECCGDSRKLGTGADVLCGYEACLDYFCAAGEAGPVPQGEPVPDSECKEPKPKIDQREYDKPCGEACVENPMAPCQWQRTAWSACSATCGNGTHTREATCLNVLDQTQGTCPALLCGGDLARGPLQEVCNDGACPTDPPTETLPPTTAAPLTPAPLEEATPPPTMEPMTPVPITYTPQPPLVTQEPKGDACIIEEWNEWNECTQNDRDGRCCFACARRRYRNVYWLKANLGITCPPGIEEEPCPQEFCSRNCTVGEWLPWDPCLPNDASKSCGVKGTNLRIRKILQVSSGPLGVCDYPGIVGSQREIHETRECSLPECAKLDCTTAWTEWGPCSEPCPGKRTHTRQVLLPDNPACAGIAETEEQDCAAPGCADRGLSQGCPLNKTYSDYFLTYQTEQAELEADFPGYGTVLFETKEHGLGWRGTNISVSLNGLPTTGTRWEVWQTVAGRTDVSTPETCENTIMSLWNPTNRPEPCNRLSSDPCACAYGDLTARHQQLPDSSTVRNYTDCCLPIRGPDGINNGVMVLRDTANAIVACSRLFPGALCSRLGGCNGCRVNETYQRYLATHHIEPGKWQADLNGYGTILFETAAYGRRGTNISVSLNGLPTTGTRWEVWQTVAGRTDVSTPETCENTIMSLWNPTNRPEPCNRSLISSDACTCAYGNLTGRHLPLPELTTIRNYTDCCLPIRGPNGIENKVLVLRDNAGDIFACGSIQSSNIVTAPASHPEAALSSTIVTLIALWLGNL